VIGVVSYQYAGMLGKCCEENAAFYKQLTCSSKCCLTCIRRKTCKKIRLSTNPDMVPPKEVLRQMLCTDYERDPKVLLKEKSFKVSRIPPTRPVSKSEL